MKCHVPGRRKWHCAIAVTDTAGVDSQRTARTIAGRRDAMMVMVVGLRLRVRLNAIVQARRKLQWLRIGI